ncbi:15324_t:CDS:2 [Funneliformis geosporum]|nr:15324_t:CDS:2 [Funneliformis geosporum]
MKNCVLLFFVILSFLSICTTNALYNNITFTDPENDLFLTKRTLYVDGTILVQLQRPHPSIPNCWDPILHYHIYHPNNTMSSIKITDHGVPEFNFCLMEDGKTNYLTVTSLNSGFFILSYYNTVEKSSASLFGITISWEGKVLSSNYLHPACYHKVEGYLVRPTFIISNLNPEDGFFFSAHDGEYIYWKHFSLPDSTGNIHPLANGTINNKNVLGIWSYPIVNQGFAISYTTKSILSDTFPNAIIDQEYYESYIYFYFHDVQDKLNGPFLIHQTSSKSLEFSGINCDVDYIGNGSACIISYTKFTEENEPIPYILQVSLLSSGSVTRIVQLPSIPHSFGINLHPFLFGGYLMVAFENDSIYGYIIHTDGTLYGGWDLPQPLPLQNYNNGSYNLMYSVMSNNEIKIIQKQPDNTWKMMISRVPKFSGSENKFNNPTIMSINPTINSIINEQITNISITYVEPL